MKKQAIFSFTLALFLLFPLSANNLSPAPRRAPWSLEEKAWVEKRMKAHGVSRCEWVDGVYYFTRNGVRIKL